MDLHYSQTRIGRVSAADLFYYLMDLHYSQTSNFKVRSLRSDNKIQAFKKVNGATTLRRATIRQHYYIIIFLFLQQFRTNLYR